MADLLDKGFREIYRERMGRDHHSFMKDAILFISPLDGPYKNSS